MSELTWADLSNSNYLNADDVAGKRIPVTITKIVVETMRDGKDVPVAYFKETPKGVTLNKTRRKFLAMATKSAKVSDAIGLKLVLTEGITQFKGEDCGTIKFTLGKAAQAKQVADTLDDEIPDFGEIPDFADVPDFAA